MKSPAEFFSLLNLLWQSLSEGMSPKTNFATTCYDNFFVELYRYMISTDCDMRLTSNISYVTKMFLSFDTNITVLLSLMTLKLPYNSHKSYLHIKV